MTLHALRTPFVLLIVGAMQQPAFSQNAASPPAPNANQIGEPYTLNRPPAPETGRLFFPPERRQTLDNQRRTLQFQETVVEGDSLTLNGVVTRSSGKWTMWINGNPVTEKETANVTAKPTLDHPGKGRLRLGNEGIQTSIAVGNSVERSTGANGSPLGAGQIRVHSRNAAN